MVGNQRQEDEGLRDKLAGAIAILERISPENPDSNREIRDYIQRVAEGPDEERALTDYVRTALRVKYGLTSLPRTSAND